MMKSSIEDETLQNYMAHVFFSNKNKQILLIIPLQLHVAANLYM
jgi:hypothetical protein